MSNYAPHNSRHVYLGRTRVGLHAFLYHSLVCLSDPEWNNEDAQSLLEHLKSEGFTAHTGRYKHFSHAFRIARSEDRQPCVVINSREGSEELLTLLEMSLVRYNLRLQPSSA